MSSGTPWDHVKWLQSFKTISYAHLHSVLNIDSICSINVSYTPAALRILTVNGEIYCLIPRFSSWNHETTHYPLTHAPLESLWKLNQAVGLWQENELFCNNLLLSKETWHTEYLTLFKINIYWVNGIRTELGVLLLSQNRDLNTQRNTQSELSKRRKCL